MEILQFGRMLKRWAWLIALFLLIAGLTAAAVSYELPRVYQTTTTALVNPKQILLPGTDAGSSLSTDQLVETYVQLINATPVQQKLIADGIPRSADELAREMQVRSRGTTTLIDIVINDRDPQVAQRIAEDIVPAFNSSLLEFQSKVAGAGTRTPQLEALVPWQVPAAAPTAPVSPKPLLNIALALAAGLVLGVGLAFMLEYLDNTIKTEADVRLKLDLPLLGPVLFKGRKTLGRKESLALVTETHPTDPVSEGYRAIRTNLMFTAIDRPLKTLVVTSAAPGEGKTSTAVNLAVTMAQNGSRVVLVDADFRRPALHRVFQRTENRGLGDVIIGTATLSELLLPTGTPNLRLLCSGPTPPNPSELLGSSRMRQVVEELAKQSETIIIDSPPVGAVTDATVLGARADGVILVVERGRTEVAAVSRARDKLIGVGANLLGVVLNKVRASEAAEYYYYRYYTTPEKGKKPRRVKERAAEPQAAASPTTGPVRGVEPAATPVQRPPQPVASPAPERPAPVAAPVTPAAPVAEAPFGGYGPAPSLAPRAPGWPGVGEHPGGNGAAPAPETASVWQEQDA